MRCNRVRRNLHLFYYAELPELKREKIAEHLLHCPRCAREYSQIRGMLDGLAQAVTQSGTEAAEATWKRILAGLEPTPRFHPAYLMKVAAALIIFAIGLGVGIQLSRRQVSPAPTSPVQALSRQPEWIQYLGDLQLLLLDAGNKGLPIFTASPPGEQAIDHLLFQNRLLSRDSVSSPEARYLLEETAFLLRELQNRSETLQRDPEWLQRVIEQQRLLERIRILLNHNPADFQMEVQRAPVI